MFVTPALGLVQLDSQRKYTFLTELYNPSFLYTTLIIERQRAKGSRIYWYLIYTTSFMLGILEIPAIKGHVFIMKLTLEIRIRIVHLRKLSVATTN